MKRKAFAAIVMFVVLSVVAGCGVSLGYRDGVKSAYPKVATRLDGYGATTEASGLRDATAEPITYAKASAAWDEAAPVYRRSVQNDASLAPHRRQDWLDTADLLDKLQQVEWKRQHWLFPSTRPVTP